MRMDIRKTNIPWSTALATYAERLVQRRLGRLRLGVRSVMVRFSDINGPRGGEDKRCYVTA